MSTENVAPRTWKLLLITDMPEIREGLMKHLSGLHATVDTLSVNEVGSEVFRSSPDVVLLHEPANGTGPDMVAFIRNESPHSEIIYLAEVRDFVAMREIIRTGAADIVVVPDEEPMLADVVRRALRKKQSEEEMREREKKVRSDYRGRGQIFTFYSAKGGAGTTVLATTIAQTLQLDHPYNVLLVDLNLQFGGAESVLGIRSDRSVYNLLPVIDELNEVYLRNVAVRLDPSQLDVLVSPNSVEKAEAIQPEHIQRLLRVSRRYYDYIVVDVPSHVDENTYMALQESDRIFYILNPEVPALQAYRKTLDLFRKLSIDVGNDHFGVVLNRVNRKNEVSDKDLQDLDDIHVIDRIKEDWKNIQSAYNLGIPLRESTLVRRLSPFARQIREMTEGLVSPQTKGKKASEGKRKGGGFLAHFSKGHSG